MGKGKLPVSISLMLLLALTGAGSLSASAGMMETEGRYLAVEAGDAEEGTSSAPFGEMPDMQKLTEAMEIIGDTPLDELSDAQLRQLADAGVDLETLKDSETLLDGVRDTLPEDGGFPWAPVTGAAVAAAAGCTAAVVFLRRKKRPK